MSLFEADQGEDDNKETCGVQSFNKTEDEAKVLTHMIAGHAERSARDDCRARITSKELAPLHSVKNGILQNACSASPRVVADLVDKCSFAHCQVDEQPTKRSKTNSDKSAVAMLKITRQLGCVFQDMEPPKSILRKSSDIRKPIRCVKFTKAVARHAPPQEADLDDEQLRALLASPRYFPEREASAERSQVLSL